MVPAVGLEPTRLATGDFESPDHQIKLTNINNLQYLFPSICNYYVFYYVNIIYIC